MNQSKQIKPCAKMAKSRTLMSGFIEFILAKRSLFVLKSI
ncbi:hypothetical protein VCHENC03_0521 [Vibrio sp. HENC-03]|nr:hypothetical protein VCHENC03_0521 [Vibrio sp. HENC-03]